MKVAISIDWGFHSLKNRTNNAILVKSVVIVKASPSTLHLETEAGSLRRKQDDQVMQIDKA